MAYKQFEELPVWRKAIELAVRVHEASRAAVFPAYFGLRDQLERAALSISNNVAEGFERGTRGEVLTFLSIARGSAGEVRSMIHLCRDLQRDEPDGADLEQLDSLVLDVSRQLEAWIESLKNSSAEEPRERTEESRRAKSEAIRREAFVRQLQRIAHGELGTHTLAEP
jgi:four helix bundle protein